MVLEESYVSPLKSLVSRGCMSALTCRSRMYSLCERFLSTLSCPVSGRKLTKETKKKSAFVRVWLMAERTLGVNWFVVLAFYELHL